MTVRGIDVSKWQATTPSLTGLDFLIARASIGTRPDEKYAMHIGNARKAGLLVGAYHFNWSELSVASQVKAFLAAAGNVDFYFIDVEYAGNGVRQFSRTQTREFIKGVRAAGKTCGLYMSQSGYYTDVDNDYDWVARWGSGEPTIPWKFWQWQGSPLDKNIFNGTLTQLKALAGRTPIEEDSMAQLPITDIVPKLFDIPVGAKRYTPDGTLDYTYTTGYPNRYSPYAVGTKRAFYSTVDGKQVIRLVEPAANLRPIAPVVSDEVAKLKAEVARLTTLTAAQKAALDVAAPKAEKLDSLIKAHDEAGL